MPQSGLDNLSNPRESSTYKESHPGESGLSSLLRQSEQMSVEDSVRYLPSSVEDPVFMCHPPQNTPADVSLMDVVPSSRSSQIAHLQTQLASLGLVCDPAGSPSVPFVPQNTPANASLLDQPVQQRQAAAEQLTNLLSQLSNEQLAEVTNSVDDICRSATSFGAFDGLPPVPRNTPASTSLLDDLGICNSLSQNLMTALGNISGETIPEPYEDVDEFPDDAGVPIPGCQTFNLGTRIVFRPA